MTRELIESFRQIVKPFCSKRLYAENYQGMGEIDKAEFERDFDAILDLAIKATERQVEEKLVKIGTEEEKDG